VVCDEGFADCDTIPTNGCEIDLSSNALHCGACGESCPSGAQAAGVCVQGTCTLACISGFANCDNDLSNGCEVNLGTNIDNCGFCGNACTSQGETQALCISGQCTLQCQGTQRDCNLNSADGCEVDTSSDAKNCGTCGNVCENNGKCVQGACECAGTSAEAEAVQLAMFVMLDKSGSMLDTVGGGSTRWDAVRSALNQFFGSAEAAGIKVALNYFPLQDPSGTTCSENYYYNPAVPMGLISGPGDQQVNALSASMAAAKPEGGTPTQVALAAALKYAADWKLAFPNDKPIVVLATDGEPGDGCGATLENSTAAAANGNSGSPSVPTYVIGVGPQLANLDQIASAGGTTKSFPVNDGNTSAFIEALKQIKQQAVACEFALPAPTSGSLNLNKINFQFSSGGGEPQFLGNVADAAGCDPAKGGWFYDDPLKPSKILLCESSCTSFQTDPTTKINILLGCDTVKE
jgi:Mg-chelatase subunit ChlD